MGLLNNIEKLINEHGSSAILREHLSLFKSQVIALEKENASLKPENGILKDKVKTLDSQLENTTKEIERQHQIIKALQDTQGIKKYDEVTEQILKLFFDTGRELSINDFALAMSLNINIIQYHFDILLQNDLITQTRVGFESSWTGESSPCMYDLTPSGRKYIVENKIT